MVKIADFLSPGRDNAITLTGLCRITGLDGRTVRRMIHSERLAGALIISDNLHGYFLPASAEDAHRFAVSMAGRAGSIASVALAAELATAEMSGQTIMEEWRDG